MPPLTTFRRNLALFALALGGFAIGTTEFATMGVLPEIAADLIPGYETDPQRVIAQAGTLITLYALGVVVGAPVFAVLGARMSQTKLALWLLVLLVAGTVGSALVPGFGAVAVFRFISGLPHGAYFGVASLLAARLMGPGNMGKGIALAMSGLTVANVIGVPLSTVLGQQFGWRWVYGLVAVLFVATLLLVALYVPRFPGSPERSPLRELAALGSARVWIMVAVLSIGFGGFFAVYSYIAEVTTREAGLGAGMVPWVIATMGIGMVLGNILGGILTDRSPVGTAFWGFVLFIASFVLYSLFAAHPLGLFVFAFLVSFASSVLLPGLQARLIRMSSEARLLGAALNHAAGNVANSLGAWLGGLVIAGGFGYLAPGWLGAALAGAGLVLLLVSLAVQRRDGGKSLDTAGIPVA
ncbi:MAG: MFS transporter [Leucobacter sp.]|nr:MFS transporter [Leucobacter sp.]